MLRKLRKIYSLNFDVGKRKKSDIKFIILHYTGMKNEKHAISRLLSKNSKEIIKLNHTFNSQQIEWYKNGSALNLIKANNLL